MNAPCLLFYLLMQFPDLHAHITGGAKPREVYEIYRGCGFIKTCVKLCLSVGPDDGKGGCQNCITNRNCPGLATVRYENGKLHSQLLIQQVSPLSDYIVIGIGDLKSMLNNPFVACVHRPDQSVKKRMILLSGYTSQDYTGVHYFDMSNASKHIFHPVKLKTVPVKVQQRPALLCEFTWKTEFTISQLPVHKSFNLITDPYYILVATGHAGDPNRADWVLSGHAHNVNGRTITNEKSLLTKTDHHNSDYDEDYDCEEADCVLGTSILHPSSCQMFGTIIIGALAAIFRQ